MAADDAVERYLAESVSWELDRLQQLRVSARRAWILAGIATLLAVLGVVAVVGLTPLKSVQPFVVRVDNSSGVVDVVPMYSASSDLPEVVTRQLLNAYVTARERFILSMAEADYDTVGAYNAPTVNQAWSGLWARNNPESPLVRYRDGTTVRAQVQSISFLRRSNGVNDLAQVRFSTSKRIGGSGVDQVTHWISTLQYAYATPSNDERLRALNPLGFKILDYRREPEVVDTAGSAR